MLRTSLSFLLLLSASLLYPQAGQTQTRPERDGVVISGKTATLRVTGPRPLADALYQLSKTFGWRIGFEETPLLFRGDMVDVTSPQYVPKSANDRAYDPRGGPLELLFTAPANPGDVSEQATVIRHLLAVYESKAYPGHYTLDAKAVVRGYLHVFPESTTSTAGHVERVKALTMAEVAVTVGDDEKNIKVIQDVLAQLKSAAGKDILFAGVNGMVSQSLMEPASRELQTHQLAFEILSSAATNSGFSFWQLLYDPSGMYYVFSFRR